GRSWSRPSDGGSEERAARRRREGHRPRQAPACPRPRRYPPSMPTTDFGRFEKILRLGEGRRLKRVKEQAAYVTSLEPEFEGLTDDELRVRATELRQRVENGESLDDVLYEAFAAVREARRRESGQRLFDVQLMGGIVLHEGDIAEMKTGEGKTFVASLPLFLNALSGSNVHLVTVNDYLAKR